jgi:hypothetical protein
MADCQDLYLERFRRVVAPASAAASGGDRSGNRAAEEARFEAETATGWEPVARRVEAVAVRGRAAPLVLELFRTAHGPLLLGDPAAGWGVSGPGCFKTSF